MQIKKFPNSAWGAQDFVNDLASDKSLTPDEMAKVLKEQIHDLDPQSLKYLSVALVDKVMEKSGDPIAMPHLEKADHNLLEALSEKIND